MVASRLSVEFKYNTAILSKLRTLSKLGHNSCAEFQRNHIWMNRKPSCGVFGGRRQTKGFYFDHRTNTIVQRVYLYAYIIHQGINDWLPYGMFYCFLLACQSHWVDILYITSATANRHSTIDNVDKKLLYISTYSCPWHNIYFSFDPISIMTNDNYHHYSQPKSIIAE